MHDIHFASIVFRSFRLFLMKKKLFKVVKCGKCGKCISSEILSKAIDKA